MALWPSPAVRQAMALVSCSDLPAAWRGPTGPRAVGFKRSTWRRLRDLGVGGGIFGASEKWDRVGVERSQCQFQYFFSEAA